MYDTTNVLVGLYLWYCTPKPLFQGDISDFEKSSDQPCNLWCFHR